jgi:lysine biosynthesis protein LysW
MSTTPCLDCGRSIYLENRIEEGQLVTCRHCGTQFEIINLEPVELDWVYNAPPLNDFDLLRAARLSRYFPTSDSYW